MQIPERLTLAAQYHEAGRLDEAEAQYRAILQEEPRNPHALHLLGVRLHQAGRHHEAIDLINQALSIHGPHPVFHSNLAAAYAALGMRLEADAHLQAALRLKPDFAEAQNRLGLLHLSGGNPGQAARNFQEAVRLQPGFVEAHNNLAAVYQDQSQTDEAMQCYRTVLRLDPGNNRARNSLAYALQSLGKIDEALAEFREALRLDPNNSQAIFHLSELASAGHYRFEDPEIQRMKQLASRAELPIDDQCRLNFALAQIFDKSTAYDEAFAHCRRANELRAEIDRRCGIGFDPNLQRQFTDRMMAAFTPDYFKHVSSFGLDSEVPVFIVGMMRSGTSLAEQILASHPQVHGAGELPDIGRLSNALPQRLGVAEPYPECIARLDSAMTRTLAEKHLERLGRLAGEAPRVVDKAPNNYFHLGVIVTLFPRSRIIHCRRDPVDTCLSCFFQNFANPYPYTHDLAHLGLYYREYERLMAHWARVLPAPILELQYEDLIADQEQWSRRMIEFCGLEWDDRCLRFAETQRPVRTASALQVRKPIYKSSMGRWRRYEQHLEPLLEALKATPG